MNSAEELKVMLDTISALDGAFEQMKATINETIYADMVEGGKEPVETIRYFLALAKDSIMAQHDFEQTAATVNEVAAKKPRFLGETA